ncbi:Clr5 domain-containing protein [Cadophora sp. MPI-SDFR-AT-0126]|nr:Clr5 domain-containing protein [Leotiomycetes sp. MPI-SDFR-AT-0126]
MSTSRAKSISSNESHDWDSIKDIFATLYVTEDRPLREVRAILAEKYGFNATERMYKRRINHWQLDKNNKEEEMQFLAQKSAERAAIGKRSAFRVRNREITQAALDHYFKRKKISKVGSRKGSSGDVSTPPHIVCYTPPDTPTPETSESSSPDFAPSDTPSTGSDEPMLTDNSPTSSTIQVVRYRPPADKYWLPGSPNQLEAPGHFKSMEILLSATQDFFQSTLIAKDGVDAYHVTQQAMSWNMRKFYVLANSVATYMSEGSWQEAQTAYGQTLEHVGPVLRDRNPILFVCLLQICCKFLKDRQLPALRPLLQLVRGMAAHVHSVSHSMHIICGVLLESMDVLADIMTMGLFQAVDILKLRLGMEHPQTCAAGRGLHTTLMVSHDYVGALKAFQPVADIEARLASAMRLESRFRVIGSLMAMGDLNQAAILIEEAQVMVDRLENPEQKAQLTLGALSTRGEWLRLSRDPRAVAVLSEAYEFAKAHTWLHNGSWSLNARKALRLAKNSALSDAPLVPFIYWF